MRVIKLILLIVILIAIVVLAIANRDMVTLELLPSGLAYLLPGASVELPLFIVIVASILVGMIIGYLFEYLREYKHRRLASRKIKEANDLNRENERLRRETNKPKDDVLALVGN